MVKNKIVVGLTALGIVTGLCGLTASPAHAATPNFVRRYSSNFTISFSAPNIRCTAAYFPGERSFDVQYGTMTGPPRRSFRCTDAATRDHVIAWYFPFAGYDSDRWAWMDHSFHIEHINGSTGHRYGNCGWLDPYSNLNNYARNTFGPVNSQILVRGTWQGSCGNGTVTVSVSFTEGWGAFV